MDHLAQIQIPALVACIALLLEGLAAFSPLAGLFQVVPILASFGAVYFAWSGGYYFLAILYALAGILACGAFFSVRLIANIPGIAIYLLILFMPRVQEGPQGDLFSMIQFPVLLLLTSGVLAAVVIVLGFRFTAPRQFLLAVVGLATTLAATCSEMLANFGWVPLQRGLSFGVGLVVLIVGYFYYRTALAWRTYQGHQEPEAQKQQAPIDPKLHAELTQWVLELEEFRKIQGYRLNWLQAITREAGIQAIFDELVQSGKLLHDARATMTTHLGPRAPVKGVGLSSDPIELLAVSHSANLEEIKESYQRIAAFFHHDRVNQLTPEAQKLARKMAGEVSKAYRALSKS